MNTIYLRFVTPAILFSLALFFLVIALKTLLSKRPLLMTSRWLFALMCVAFLPQMLDPFLFKSFTLIMWLNPLMFCALLIFFWIQMKGYLVFGVSDSYFRDALLSSIKSLGHTPEETMSRLRIKETGEEFQVAIQGWVGCAQFRPVGKSSTLTTRKIEESMRQYFTSTPGKMNYIVAYLYLIIGLFMIVVGGSISYLPHTFKH